MAMVRARRSLLSLRPLQPRFHAQTAAPVDEAKSRLAALETAVAQARDNLLGQRPDTPEWCEQRRRLGRLLSEHAYWTDWLSKPSGGSAR